jgi:CysZ protein
LRKQAVVTSYCAMMKAAYRALDDLTSPEFRVVVWKAVGLSLVLFIAVFFAVQAVFWFLTLFPWPWVETVAAIGSGLLLLVAFFFLMVPVTALFAGLYLDDVAARVEQKHYARDGMGKPQPTFKSVLLAVQFALLVLVVNVLALPLVFTGFGAIVLVVINAYLLSREYFEMAAMRFMPVEEAKDFRRENGLQVFAAGFLPAVMALVPLVNLTVPVFATSYFVHLFKQVRATSV